MTTIRMMKLTLAMIMSIGVLVGCVQTNTTTQSVQSSDTTGMKQVSEATATAPTVSEATASQTTESTKQSEEPS